MHEPLAAEERLRRLRRDKRRVLRERMARQVAAPVWEKVRSVVPTPFPLTGELHVRALEDEPDRVRAALAPHAVFALDTAMRMHCGAGCLSGGDLHAYIEDAGVLDALASQGLIAAEPSADRVLARPWPGRSRLFAVVVHELPVHELGPDGFRRVTRERAVSEVIGVLGPRLDVLAPLVMPSAPGARR